MPVDWDQLIPTRKSLLSRLKHWDDNKSYREFDKIYQPLIYGTAIAAGLTEAEAEDVVQETTVAVAKAIRDLKFTYQPERCSFKTWLHGIAKRKVADQFRKRLGKGRVVEPLARDNEDSSPANMIPDAASQALDEIWDREWELTLLEAALERVKRQVSPGQFQIYHYYVVQGHGVGKTAKALGVSSAGVYLAKNRVGKKVRAEIAHLRNKLV
jgi:RNA polymerase sigma factor (sigma-70 family)